MPRTFARFDSALIGPSLLALNGGIALTTTADNLSLARTARSDGGHAAGTHGAEFTFWGEAVLNAVVGVVQGAHLMQVMVGGDNLSAGWRLDTGQVVVNNAVVASGLPIVSKGEIVGVRVLLDSGPTLEFYRGTTLVHSMAIGGGVTYHYAVSLGGGLAGEIACAVNAGQWQGQSAALLQGTWQPAPAAVTPVRLSDLDYLTAATDAPAHARYEGLIDAAGIGTFAALAFWPWGGDAPAGGGSARLQVFDADGVLDALAEQDASGVAVAVRIGDTAGTLAASAAIARYVVERVEILDDARKVVYLRDAHEDLDEPLTRGVFLPSIPSLAWRAQPMVIGAVASIPALPANSDGSVAFLADAPLAGVDAVLDRGDAMEAGTWSLDPSDQQLLLNSPPLGPVVVDASSIGPAMQPATLEQALREIFRRIGKGSWSATDAAAIDAATGYAGIGYYAGEAISVRAALAAILPSYAAWWWQDGDGVLRFARLVDPTAYAGALAFDLLSEDLGEDLLHTPDNAPNLTRRMAYRPNAMIMAPGDIVTDLVDVPPSRRVELTSPWRGIAFAGNYLAPRYRHADRAEPMVSVFWKQEDAYAEIWRVCKMYMIPRHFYYWRLRGEFALAPSPGQVGRITYPRYGLSAGKQVLVRAIERNPVTGEVTLTLWG